MDSLDTLFAGAWRLYKTRFSVLLKITLVPAVLIVLGQLAISRRTPTAEVIGVLIGFVGWLTSIVASLALIVAAARDAKMEDAYGTALKLFLPSLWIAILEGIVVMGGFVLFIIPGIFVAIALAFANFALVLEDRRGMHALAESREYVRGYWWAILGRNMLLALIYGALVMLIYTPFTIIFGGLVGGIVYGLLLLAIVPFGICYSYTIYENLRCLKPAAADDAARASRTFFIVCMVVALVAALALIVAIAFLVRPAVSDPYWWPKMGTSGSV